MLGLLIERMCEAPKARGADQLISAAHHHPDYDDDRERLGEADLDELLDTVRDANRPVVTRAIAAWLAAGTDRYPTDHLPARRGDLDALVFTLEGIAPARLIAPCQLAAKMMRFPLAIMVPLLWSAMARSSGPADCKLDVALPQTVRGLPFYACDPNHTRLGKLAVQRWWKATTPLRSFTPAQIG